MEQKLESLPSCKNCKYWKTGGEEDDYIIFLDIGVCENTALLWESTYTEGESDLNIFKAIKKDLVNTKAFVQDGEDYHAELHTKPDFYCNQYKYKGD